MASDFRQTSSALRGDLERSRRSLALVTIPAALVALIILWAVLAQVPVYAVSDFARLQARDAVHPVDTLVSGRVLRVHLPVGGKVASGDILIELDATDATLRLDEAVAAERGFTQQITALEAELTAREAALASTEQLGRASLSEAQATRTEVQAQATYAERERKRAVLMTQAGVAAEAEADRANATAAQAVAAVAARDHRLTVLSNETRRELSDRRAQNESLRRDLAALRVQRDSGAIGVKRLEVEVARHTIRAPVDGLLGQIRAPQVGSVLAVGQTIAVVTPETALAMVADFAPSEVIGRVRAGQRARMRVTGFPWTQYGTLDATVTAVSSEVADGKIRVELALASNAGSPIPTRHGLVGAVEVEVEHASPAILVARAAGHLFEPSETP